MLTQSIGAPKSKVTFIKRNQLSQKNWVAHSRHFISKVSGVPGYVLLALYGTKELNLLASETANDFIKFYLFIL